MNEGLDVGLDVGMNEGFDVGFMVGSNDGSDEGLLCRTFMIQINMLN